MYFIIGSDCQMKLETMSFTSPLPSKRINLLETCTGSNNRVLSLISVSDLPVVDQFYNYSIVGSSGTLEGSFHTYANARQLKFGFVSCNDNASGIESWNKSAAPGTSMWPDLYQQKVDVLVHMGDQVYADSVYAEMLAGAADWQRKYVDLYYASFAEESQNRTMRHCLNIGMHDDHDFVDSFGTPGYFTRSKQSETYLAEVRRVLPIVSMIPQDVPFNDETFYTYHVDIAGYRIVVMDTRLSLYYTNSRFSTPLIEYVKNHLCKDTLLVLPQPLVHLSKFHASLQGLVYGDGVDESTHPVSYDGMTEFRSMLFDHLRPKATSIKIVSGDIHNTFIQTQLARVEADRGAGNLTRLTSVSAAGTVVYRGCHQITTDDESVMDDVRRDSRQSRVM